MLRSRRATTVVVSLLLALTLSAGTGAVADDGPTEPDVPDTFVGLDGLTHTVSDVVIKGQGDMLYLGADFDTACAFGSELDKALRSLSRLADIIEKSGRTVIWTVPPNKSLIYVDDLPDPLPQGDCAARGMKIQRKILDRHKDPRYVPLRKLLSATPQAYWRTDSHWSTVGGAVQARAWAKALDPALAKAQKYRRTTRTKWGDLAPYIEGSQKETSRALLPANGVVTVAAPGSDTYDPKKVFNDLSWRSAPQGKTYPGKTLVLGDSFTYTSFEGYSNLFQRGRFMWVGFQTLDELTRAVTRSDTVVFSVVQRYAPISTLVSPTFQVALRRALREHDARR